MYFQFIIGLFLICLSQVAGAEEQSGISPKQTVDKLNSVLIDVMKNAKQLGYQGRYKKLDSVVRETHEFDAIAQIALGNHWKNLDLEQKKAFVQKLADLSVATYAAQFNDYAGEEFKYESEQGMKSNRVLLRYSLAAPKEKPVKFEYILNQTGGKWAIINIVVDGISDLALKKAQYTSVIDREGFDSLLNKLAQKISDYATSNAKSG
ncbi:MAG: hopanoid biosynthesis associated rane protein HpnM [Proteobacteria bacterium]|nr:hopanoid biosynthesis associated rane protein HpnM [Pseudomonadota bacterium]